jgi:UDP-glucose 4-epimerase
MLAGEPITINGDGEQTRDFVHVSDIAYANYLAIMFVHPSGIYNLGSGIPTSIKTIFKTLKAVSGYTFLPLMGKEILGETKHIHLDSSKAMRDLNFLPDIPLEDGLKETFRYFQTMEKV